MNTRILISLSLIPFFAQLGGCHYWFDATPRLIVSSEPFVPPSPDTFSPRPLAYDLPATTETDPGATQK